MMKIFKYSIVLLFINILSGCSLAFLASKNQYVKIPKDSLAVIRINDKVPTIENGMYQFQKSEGPMQLKLEKKGFKDEYRVIMPYKKSGLYYATYVENGILFGLPAGLVGGSVGAAFLGPHLGILSFVTCTAVFTETFGSPATSDYRLWSFPAYYDLNIPMKPILVRDSSMKEVYLDKLSVNAKKENQLSAHQSIKKYLKNEPPKYTKLKGNQDLKLENTVYSDEINDELKKNGFIDTSGYALRGSFRENLFLKVEINQLKLLNVVHPKFDYGFSKISMESRWNVMDIYKNIIYSDSIHLVSGEFVSDEETSLHLMINDGIKSGLVSLMSSDRFSDVIKIAETDQKDHLVDIVLPQTSKYVSDLKEAVAASVTIVTKSGHGSGFFISEDGYLITNYHVIADSTNLEIVLNDGSKCKGKLIQFNKDADLALLKIDKIGFIPFSIADNDIARMGRDIYVIGTPTAKDLSQTITKGIISSIRKQPDGTKVIQTDASVSRGNSGGPLVDKSGTLLGVVNAKLIGWGIEGISFAIPTSQIANTLKIKFK